ncbi:hypothetical protein ACFCXG_38865, partial [Streptomyces sp. NPDC056295]
MSEDAGEDLAVKLYGVARRPEERTLRCEAAVCTVPDGARAHALLAGVGDTAPFHPARTAARRPARVAAGRGGAEAGLRAESKR